MVRGRGRRWAGFLTVVVLVAAGCGSGETERAGSEPVAEPGTVTNPSRPLIVRPLPDGWSVRSVRMTDFDGLRESWARQTLYLPPGSTPEDGPALVIGHHSEEWGETLCGQGRPVADVTNAFPGSARLVQSGSLLEVGGYMNRDEPGYVIARGISEEQVLAAARAARFPDRGEVEIGVDGLPPQFRRVASAPVPPNTGLGQMIQLANADQNEYVSIGAYDGSAAADLVTRFWAATLAKHDCEGPRGPWAKTQRRVGETEVFVEGGVSQKVVDQVAASLVATDEAGLEAFRAEIGELPAAAVVGGCFSEPGTGVLVDGTDEGVRWVLGMSLDTAAPNNCSGFVIDGEVQSGAASWGPPVPAGEGSFGIEVRANSLMSGHVSATLQLVGGTVPASATRVVIAGAGDARTNAKLKDGATDPNRQYFGGLLFVPMGDVNLPTVVAYDAAKQVVGRYVPVPR